MAMVVFSPGRPLACGMSSARGRHRRREAEPAELAVDLERRRPEMRPAADIGAAAGVHGGERPDRVPVAGHRGGRAEPALEVDRGGAEARPGGAEREVGTGGGRGGVTELTIGRKAAPILVAAIEQVEQHRAADDRNANVPDREAAALLAQPGLHAGRRVEPEGGAARQHHRVDALDRAVRLEQVGFARARGAAAHVDRRDRWLVEQDGGHPGGETGIVGVPDADAGHVGDEIAPRHSSVPIPKFANPCGAL